MERRTALPYYRPAVLMDFFLTHSIPKGFSLYLPFLGVYLSLCSQGPLGWIRRRQYWRRSGNEPQLQVIGKEKRKREREGSENV